MSPSRAAAFAMFFIMPVLFACAPAATKAQLSDAGVKAKILWELRAGEVDMTHLTVEVHGGAATVSGLVPNQAQQRRIHDLLIRTPGVKEAIENVVVETPP
jgi:osmotically-inducible protein OsmY